MGTLKTLEHSKGTKTLGHSKHLCLPGTWALKTQGYSWALELLGHSKGTEDTQVLKTLGHLDTLCTRGTLFSRLTEALPYLDWKLYGKSLSKWMGLLNTHQKETVWMFFHSVQITSKQLLWCCRFDWQIHALCGWFVLKYFLFHANFFLLGHCKWRFLWNYHYLSVRPSASLSGKSFSRQPLVSFFFFCNIVNNCQI